MWVYLAKLGDSLETLNDDIGVLLGDVGAHGTRLATRRVQIAHHRQQQIVRLGMTCVSLRQQHLLHGFVVTLTEQL